jgi:hypothetical protein
MAHCSSAHYDLQHHGDDYGRLFTASNVSIRRYPHTSCARIGVGNQSHTISYWCWQFGTAVTRDGETWYSWTYITDDTTGVSGFVSDAYLANGGSGHQCGLTGLVARSRG